MTARLPKRLRWRAAERARVDEFLDVIRATAPEGTVVEVEPPTAALPMVLVTLLVPVAVPR